MRLAWLGKRREHPRPPIRLMRLAARAIVVPFLEMFDRSQEGVKQGPKIAFRALDDAGKLPDNSV